MKVIHNTIEFHWTALYTLLHYLDLTCVIYINVFQGNSSTADGIKKIASLKKNT